MANRFLPAALWDLIEPLLPIPEDNPEGGRPRRSDRACLTGILFVLRSGIPGGCCQKSWVAREQYWTVVRFVRFLGASNRSQSASMYDKLERVILPMFYVRPNAYAEVMGSAIAINGSFFNTQRMMAQYVLNAYFPDEAKPSP